MRTKTYLLVAIMIVAFGGDSTAHSADGSPSPLVLRGEVSRVRIDHTDGYVICRVAMRLAFVNIGSEPVILVKPWREDGLWFGGTSLFATSADSARGAALVTQYFGESFDGSEHYQRLAQSLDQPEPPSDLTVTVEPGQEWTYETTVEVKVAEERSPSSPERPTWRDVVAQGTMLGLEVSFEAWPFNVETVQPNLGSRLEKRWRHRGRLLIGERHDTRRHKAVLRSERMIMDLAGTDAFDGDQPAQPN